MNPPVQVLWVGGSVPDLASSPFGPFVLTRAGSLDQAAQALGTKPPDALVLRVADPSGLRALLDWRALSHAVLDTAVIVVAPELQHDIAVKLVGRGVQDLLPADAADASALARVLRLSVERKRLETAARKAYATDLGTGLPNHAQLLEHMSHLLALREREPAPMALLVLRIDGLSATEAALGAEAANVLRRKVAVRLRAGLRASDVVAAIGVDSFAVLLAWIDSPSAGQRVAAKLEQSLRQSFKVSGQEREIGLSVGLSQYPEHGRLAEELLRRALRQAHMLTTSGDSGFGDLSGRGPAAANDDERLS